MKRFKNALTLIAVILVLNMVNVNAFASEFDDVQEGTYYINAKLSCYINAMGGIEFGEPLLTSAQVKVKEDGSKEMTLSFGKSKVTIYGVTCDTFIDFSPSYVTDNGGVKSGTLGFYDENGDLNTDDVDFILSEDTAENAQQEQVHYVEQLIFPIDYESDTYYLTLYVNSNVMGTQFTLDGYPAVLTVDWSSISVSGDIQDSNITDTADISKDDTATNKVSVENKDGLNIYLAEDTDSEKTQEPEVKYTQVAYFKENILTFTGTAALVMILIGIILMIAGRRKKYSENN